MDYDSANLNRGRKKYEAKIKDIEGIFIKVKNILNITEYEGRLEQIKNAVNNDFSLANNMGSFNMQMDYEDMAMTPYINSLDELLNDLNSDLTPFYELYLLCTKINMLLKNITWENINEIIKSTKELIDSLKDLNTHGDLKKEKLLASAYQTIYSVILYEAIFNRNDTLTYINYLNIPVHRENIGRLLNNDLKKLNTSDLISEELKGIKEEGLGYDYLNEDTIKKVSIKTVGETNSEYQERKRNAIDDLTIKVNNILERKNHLTEDLTSINETIRNLHIKKGLVASKILALAMVPIITITAGNMIGKKASKKITEYQTITRTIDLKTNEVIDEPTIIYDDKETTYVATILIGGPWKANPTGVGYIQNVTAYEYKVPENIPDDYHINIDDLEGNLLKKYTYSTTKDTLEARDSITDSTVLVTETYQNKNENRPSTRFIIPFTIGGTCLGLFLDVLLILLGKLGFTETKRRLDKLNHEIANHKLTASEIKEELIQMKTEALNLQDEYNDIVKNFGNLNDEFIFHDINELCGSKNVRQRIKK